MKQPKYKPGDKVYHYRWKHTGKSWPETVISVVPKKWYHIQQRYVITDWPENLATQIVKEKDLFPRKGTP